MLRTVRRGREVFDGRVVWNVNSTARGGGVAEMLVSLLAYARGAGIDARWVVIAGNEDFFVLTKRIHNFLHGSSGDGGDLDDDERRDLRRGDRPQRRRVPGARQARGRGDHPRPAAGRPDPGGPRHGLPDGVALSRRSRPPRSDSRAGRGTSSSPMSATRTPTSSRARPSSGRGSTKEDHDHPALDRRLLAQEPGSRPRARPVDPHRRRAQRGRRGRPTDLHALGRQRRAASTAPLTALGSGARCARPTGSWSRSRAGTRSRTRSG